MAGAKGVCDECGKTKVLHDRIVNQELTRRMCAKCIEDDRLARSERATGAAGAPHKRQSQLENVVWRFVLTEAQSKRVEAWLVKNGFGEGRNPALKRWANSL